MKGRLALLLLLAASANAQPEYYIGLQAGGLNHRAYQRDGIKLSRDSYLYSKRHNSYSSILGLITGIDYNNFGIELEGNLANARQALKQTPVDTSGPAHHPYQHEFAHVGNLGLGLKFAYPLGLSVKVYAKPMLSAGFFRSKILYTEDLDKPINYYRKTKKRLGGGLAIGIEKRMGSFKVSTEARYLNYRSFKYGLDLNDIESARTKIKPHTVSATIRIAYCF
ncbi:outer membrane beta-barrel protein [Candidatus Odyssella thessalonicensis]|uniref:outer membrane beta-barrel protein n=1 Tax=Candidatus Odyssella thessalonicensis TaxID=84647 RepID=UPI000225B904|nr:outer membrane beta-barrel protein [Candidatus Odyssella thessalonicensis]